MNDGPMRIAVLGAGAWGQALALHFDRLGHAVTLGARAPGSVLDGHGRSVRLGAVAWPTRLPIRDLDAVARMPDAAVVLVATPTAGLAAVLSTVPERGRAPLVLCAKGFDAARDELPPELAGRLRPERCAAVLTGPTLAHELAAGLPAAAVIAAHGIGTARTLAAMLRGGPLRLYPSADPVGAAIGGAAKNVIAIAAGVAIGAGLGENARAAVVVRGLAEIARLASALGGDAETIAGLAGAGDLVLTATSVRSRNFSAGVALAAGRPTPALGDAVAEGVAAAPSLLARAARAGVELPVASVVAALLAGGIDVATGVQSLVGRKPPQGESSSASSSGAGAPGDRHGDRV